MWECRDNTKHRTNPLGGGNGAAVARGQTSADNRRRVRLLAEVVLDGAGRTSERVGGANNDKESRPHLEIRVKERVVFQLVALGARVDVLRFGVTIMK